MRTLFRLHIVLSVAHCPFYCFRLILLIQITCHFCSGTVDSVAVQHFFQNTGRLFYYNVPAASTTKEMQQYTFIKHFHMLYSEQV